MKTKICSAIKNMKRLKIRYNGTDRIVEPHAYGLDKNKNEKLRAFQVSGSSKSGNPLGWKLFKCGDISKITEINQEFNERPGYNHDGDSQIPKMICMI